jgi:hypothetical protein
MNITVIKDALLSNYIKIYINDILHLAIKRKELVNVQTWKNDTNGQSVFTIELSYKDGAKVITEYNDVEKFTKIVKCIDDNLD